MRRAIFNYKSFEEMIEKYNPFGFKYSDGRICMFEDYKKAYYYAMRKLIDDFEAGYVDIILYLNKNTGLPVADCEKEVARMRSLWGKSDVRLFDLRGFSEETPYLMKNFIKSLHMITETEFDESAYQQAYVDFRNWAAAYWSMKDAKEAEEAALKDTKV